MGTVYRQMKSKLNARCEKEQGYGVGAPPVDLLMQICQLCHRWQIQAYVCTQRGIRLHNVSNAMSKIEPRLGAEKCTLHDLRSLHITS